MTESDLRALTRAGESETSEFKRLTGQVPRAGETLCGFLNGRSGQVISGVAVHGHLPWAHNGPFQSFFSFISTFKVFNNLANLLFAQSEPKWAQ